MASNSPKLKNIITPMEQKNLDGIILDQALDRLIDCSKTMPLYILYKHLTSIKKEFSWAKIDINYRSNSSMAFASREIDSVKVESDDEGRSVYVVINFLGFQCVETPLPLNHHEQIVTDVNQDKLEMDQFYNFFNHRLIEMLIETRFKYDYIHQVEEGLNDKISKIWTSLAGIYNEVAM